MLVAWISKKMFCKVCWTAIIFVFFSWLMLVVIFTHYGRIAEWTGGTLPCQCHDLSTFMWNGTGNNVILFISFYIALKRYYWETESTANAQDLMSWMERKKSSLEQRDFQHHVSWWETSVTVCILTVFFLFSLFTIYYLSTHGHFLIELVVQSTLKMIIMLEAQGISSVQLKQVYQYWMQWSLIAYELVFSK